jgi:hypothetical protein
MNSVDISALTVSQVTDILRLFGRKTRLQSAEKPRHVIVRAYSGVFWGWLVARRGSEVDLRNARHIHGWNSEGLPRKAVTVEDIADIGVGSTSRLSGTCAMVTVFDVKLIADCTTQSSARIEAVPCK